MRVLFIAYVYFQIMRAFGYLSLAFILLVVFTFPALASESSVFPGQFVWEALHHYQNRHRVPGVAAVVYYEGQPYLFTLGKANLKTMKPVTSNTLFELGSITKSFTAIILATEVMKHKVRLADPAVNFLVGLHNFKGPFSQVTLKNLALHNSGLDRTIPAESRRSYFTIIEYLRHWHPKYAVGTHFQYSNFGFGLLGIVLEQAAKKTYEELLRENVLYPLRMDSTFIQVPARYEADYAQGYTKEGAVASRWPITLMVASGGLKSSLEDMSKFLSACLDLPGTPREVAEAIHLTEEGDFKIKVHQTQVLSWLKTEENGYLIFTKNGGVTGFSTFMGYIPKLRIGIVILANKNAGNTKVGSYILKVLAEKAQKKGAQQTL